MATACAVHGCHRSRVGRGWCLMHYKRWQRTGYPEGETVERRFFRQVEQDVFGCWNWIGTLSKLGYGKFGDQSKHLLAHRWAYAFLRADIPAGLELDHLCRNRACVNPWHLEPVTRSINARRTFDTCNELHQRGVRPCPICHLDHESRQAVTNK
jgi:HNH endonuclease